MGSFTALRDEGRACSSGPQNATTKKFEKLYLKVGKKVEIIELNEMK